MKTANLVLGMCMVGTVFDSAALTLGPVQGSAWIGQSLALSIPVQLDPGSADADLCAQADVFYADNRQAASRVQVQQEPNSQGTLRIVQIVSASSVDEPMVTVDLRVGCAQKIARRYVLLADFPSRAEVTTPVAPMVQMVPKPTAEAEAVAVTAIPTMAPSAVDAPAANTPPGGSATKPAARPRAALNPTTTRRATRPKPTPAVAAAVPAPTPPARARLKLDPLDDLTERIKTLETTTTAIPLEEMVRDAQNIQQLQGEVKALLQQAAKNEASLTAMRERLDKAESERVSATLIYSLAALLAVCMGAIALLWNRRNPPATGRQEWSEPLSVDSEPPRHATAPAAFAPVAMPHSSAPNAAALDLDLIEIDSGAYSKLEHPAPTDSNNRDTVDTSAATAPATEPLLQIHQDFNTESQLDLRQQAQLFEGLAKTDQAIESLERRIHANKKDCPLVYLELLRIANDHSLKTDFRQYRDECQQVFNVTIPEFAQFRDEGLGLEGYPSVQEKLEKLWPSDSALDLLESCILRDPWDKNAKPFTLAAFKELIVLHGVAHQLNYPGSTPSQPATPEASQSLDLDLDL